jgi:ribosome biogenesis GTPase
LFEDLAVDQGIVIRSTGAFYSVLLANGDKQECVLRGKFRLNDLKSTNPVAVGDRVAVDVEGAQPVIYQILPRRNYILRRATRSRSQFQILCANIDLAVMVATLDQPFTPLGYIDSFLVMAEAYHIPAALIFNKTDLITAQKDKDKLADFALTYQDAGYPVRLLSLKENRGIEKVKALFENRISFISGPSGTGKTSLINALIPDLGLRTGQISDHTGKGRHTTTYACMHLFNNGAIIDAPGFREYEVVNLKRQEVAHFFPEFRQRMSQCRFNNCMHVEEPGCAIRESVGNAEIAASRYHTYLNMLGALAQQSEFS